MPGICVFCHNLEGRKLGLNDTIYDVCKCKEGKYDAAGVEVFYERQQVRKPSKEILTIQSSCDKYADRLNVPK